MKRHALAAAYVRVSSRAQDFPTQRSAIERAAAARGDQITTWYAEKRSGKTLARPELDRLRADVRTGTAARRIYCFKLDRLTRTGVADTYRVVEEFKKAGCELVAVADNLHLKPGVEDVVTDVFLFALGLAARLERQAINDRIAAARDRSEAEGRTWGRPSRVTSRDLLRLRALRDQGKTIRQIAVALKVPRSTVQRALSRKHGPGSADAVPRKECFQQGSTR